MISTLRTPIAMSDEAYSLLNEFLEETIGLHFPEHRRSALERRLQDRLQALCLTDFMDYYYYLRADLPGEVGYLADAVTNNETYFFRELDQLEALFDRKDERVAWPDRPMRVLSAGCSSGEEAFTLAFLAEDRGVSVSVDGFDLDPVRIGIARNGHCRSRSLRAMDEKQVRRYLIQAGPNRFEVRPRYRRHVSFSTANLVDRSTLRRPLPYDVIFCRNVLIYFSERSRRRAIENLSAMLRPGGLLFLGHAESIIGQFATLQTARIGQVVAYRLVP